MKSWVSSPLASGMHKGVNGLGSASTTVRTRLSARSRAPSTYSSPRSSRAATAGAEIMPRSATTQTRPIAKRLRSRSMTGTSTLEPAAQAIHDRNEHADIGGVAGPHLRADRPACGVDYHTYDHLQQV